MTASKLEFTLENLLEALKGAGLTIVDSGEDLHPHLADFRPPAPPPIFFVRIEEESGDVLGVSTQVMETVWEKFERGQMEFDGQLREDKISVLVSQKHG